MALFPPGPGGGKEVEHGYKGKGSLLHLVTDKEGMPLWITTTSAKGNKRTQALALLDQLQLMQCKDSSRMTICEADKGYDSTELRMEMLHRGYVPIIGYRRNQKNRVSTEEIYSYFKGRKKDGCLKKVLHGLKENAGGF